MIFIAGIQPRTRKLDQNPRLCTSCGLAQAYEKRIDQYLSLFFIPLIRVKKGEPLIVCERCQASTSVNTGQVTNSPVSKQKMCRSCSQLIQTSYQYCPYCGEKQ